MGATQSLKKSIDEGNLKKSIESVLEGADLSYKGKGFASFVEYARQKNSMTIASYLNAEIILKQLEKNSAGINIDAIHDDGYTILTFAAKNNIPHLTTKVLEKGASIDAIDRSGNTALIHAVESNNVSLSLQLIESKANVNVLNNWSQSPLSFAAMNQNLEILKALLENDANSNSASNTGITPLIRSSTNDDFAIVELLLKYGASVDLATTTGDTALYSACGKGLYRIAEILLEKKANINLANRDGYTPLANACKHGQVDIVKLLLQHKADPNVGANDRTTPLIQASASSGTKTTTSLDILLKAGAEINIVSLSGLTAVGRAIELRNFHSAQFLLDHDANITIGQCRGMSVQEYINSLGITVLPAEDHSVRSDAGNTNSLYVSQISRLQDIVLTQPKEPQFATPYNPKEGNSDNVSSTSSSSQLQGTVLTTTASSVMGVPMARHNSKINIFSLGAQPSALVQSMPANSDELNMTPAEYAIAACPASSSSTNAGSLLNDNSLTPQPGSSTLMSGVFINPSYAPGDRSSVTLSSSTQGGGLSNHYNQNNTSRDTARESMTLRDSMNPMRPQQPLQPISTTQPQLTQQLSIHTTNFIKPQSQQLSLQDPQTPVRSPLSPPYTTRSSAQFSQYTSTPSLHAQPVPPQTPGSLRAQIKSVTTTPLSPGLMAMGSLGSPMMSPTSPNPITRSNTLSGVQYNVPSATGGGNQRHSTMTRQSRGAMLQQNAATTTQFSNAINLPAQLSNSLSSPSSKHHAFFIQPPPEDATDVVTATTPSHGDLTPFNDTALSFNRQMSALNLDILNDSSVSSAQNINNSSPTANIPSPRGPIIGLNDLPPPPPPDSTENIPIAANIDNCASNILHSPPPEELLPVQISPSNNNINIINQSVTIDYTEAKQWRSRLDQESGDYYYYNATTKETAWDMPQCLITLPHVCANCTCCVFVHKLESKKPFVCRNCDHEHF